MIEDLKLDIKVTASTAKIINKSLRKNELDTYRNQNSLKALESIVEISKDIKSVNVDTISEDRIKRKMQNIETRIKNARNAWVSLNNKKYETRFYSRCCQLAYAFLRDIPYNVVEHNASKPLSDEIIDEVANIIKFHNGFLTNINTLILLKQIEDWNHGSFRLSDLSELDKKACQF